MVIVPCNDTRSFCRGCQRTALTTYCIRSLLRTSRLPPSRLKESRPLVKPTLPRTLQHVHVQREGAVHVGRCYDAIDDYEKRPPLRTGIVAIHCIRCR